MTVPSHTTSTKKKRSNPAAEVAPSIWRQPLCCSGGDGREVYFRAGDREIHLDRDRAVWLALRIFGLVSFFGGLDKDELAVLSKIVDDHIDMEQEQRILEDYNAGRVTLNEVRAFERSLIKKRRAALEAVKRVEQRGQRLDASAAA